MAMRHFALIAILAAFAGCGGKDEDSSSTETPKSATPSAPTSPPPVPPDERPANAVTTGEAGAAVDLQYEIAPRPETGQPFTIQLAFVPRLPADSIEVKLSATSGLRITSAESVRFADVLANERYTTEVLVVGDLPGLYYVGVVARMATPVQTDARSFSVPIVVGAPAATANASPAADASGPANVTTPTEEGGAN